MDNTEQANLNAELVELNPQWLKIRRTIEQLVRPVVEPVTPSPAEPLRVKLRELAGRLQLGESSEAEYLVAEAALKRAEAADAAQVAADAAKKERSVLALAELQSRLVTIDTRRRVLIDRLDWLERSAIHAGKEAAGHRYREALRAVGVAWAEHVAHADLLVEVERVGGANPVPLEQRFSFGTSVVNTLGPMPILPRTEAFAGCQTPQCIVINGNPQTEQRDGAEIRVDRAAIYADVRKRFNL